MPTVLDATPSGHLTFLTTSFGKPFAAAGFTNWFRDACNAAGLRAWTTGFALSASGGSRMQRQCDRRHLRPQELERGERYTIAANQGRMARMGVETLIAETKGRTGSVGPVRRFIDKKAK
jgi:hypothetical protein